MKDIRRRNELLHSAVLYLFWVVSAFVAAAGLCGLGWLGQTIKDNHIRSVIQEELAKERK